MKKFITGIVFTLMFGMVALGQAQDIPVNNPQLSLEGKTVTMKADLSDVQASRQVKVLWTNTNEFSGLHTESTLYPFYDWKYSTGNNATQLSTMYAEGWHIIQIIPYNANGAKQFYIVFEK